MKDITEFSLEINLQIVSYLSPKDIASLSLTCKYFNLVCQDESLWKPLCKKYNVVNTHGFGSYQRLYCSLLHNFGYLLGYWRYNHLRGQSGTVYPKGELLKVCIQDQKIVVNQIDASASTFNLVTAFERNIKDLVLNYTPLFEVNENQIYYPIRPGKSEFTKVSNEEFLLWSSYQLLNFRKYNPPSRTEHKFSGTWAALYGGHGIEFLSVCLVNPERPSPFPNLDECENPLRGNYLAGIKITGDRNIPAGRTSILVNLDQVHEGQNRYHAYLQIAQDGYQSPQFTEAFFIYSEDDPDSFEILWISFGVVTKYIRVNL